MHALHRLLCPVLLFIAATAFALPTEDGLYATFHTTKGDFTAKLEYQQAPLTVANFVGLAEGTQAWVDFLNGTVSHRPFYNGITFHRVISDFMIQAGSPNGQGTDGPGYSFGDEFSTALRHSSAGILSMANSGPNSNGSQFFITLAPTEWLNDKHAVFGHIVEGMNIVETIGAIPTPTQDITTIESITITAVGSEAENFRNSPPPELPKVTGATLDLTRTGSNFSMAFNRPPFSQHTFFASTQLSSWSSMGSLTDITGTTAPYDWSNFVEGISQQFYRAAKITYIHQPTEIVGKTFLFTFTSADQQITFTFTAPEGYEKEGDFGTVQIDNDAPEPLHGYFLNNTLATLYIDVSFGNAAYTFATHFQDATSGWFAAQPYLASDGFWPLFGTFQILNTP